MDDACRFGNFASFFFIFYLFIQMFGLETVRCGSGSAKNRLVLGFLAKILVVLIGCPTILGWAKGYTENSKTSITKRTIFNPNTKLDVSTTLGPSSVVWFLLQKSARFLPMLLWQEKLVLREQELMNRSGSWTGGLTFEGRSF